MFSVNPHVGQKWRVTFYSPVKPQVQCTTEAEARAAVEAAARAERDALNEAVGEGPVICDKCKGHQVVCSRCDYVLAPGYTHCDGCKSSAMNCPTCNGRGAVNGRLT